MRILVVCQYYAPEPFRITDIATELLKRGHHVDVLTGIPNYPEGRFYKGYGFAQRRLEMLNGVRVFRVPIIPRGKGTAIHLALNYASFVVSGSLRALMMPRHDYDVVLVYQLSPVMMAIPGIIAASHVCVPMVLYVADLWPESLSAARGTNNKAILRSIGRIVDWIYRKSKTILVTSKGFMDSIILRGQSPCKLKYIPQYPEDVYRPATVALDDSARKEMPKGFNIVFTGNIGVAQGLDVVIEAATKLLSYNDINWVIIGDGRAREALEKASVSKGLGQRVHFLGRRPMARIPIYLALSDVALLCLGPAPLFALTLPAKIQSYFACGIPIIGSVDGDAANVIVESGAGLAGRAGDATALAKNVLAMYRSSVEERKIYSKNALRYFNENFRKDRLITEIELNLRQAVIDN